MKLDTWEKCSRNFLAKFFPVSKTNLFHTKISNFQQENQESIPKAWERMQEYVQACPHHGMQDWLRIMSFYHGLFIEPCRHLDAAAEGAFFSLNVKQAKELIEKMVENQGWTNNHLQGTNNIQLFNSISLDSLLNMLDERANWKRN